MLAGVFLCLIGLGLAAWLHDLVVRKRLLVGLPPSGAFIETDNAVLHYLRAGPREAAHTFILIHGASANAHDMMLALGDGLAAHGAVVSIDRPGLGRSRLKTNPQAMTDPLAQASEIHAAVTALGIRKPIIIGQSFGGSVALAYAKLFGQDIAGTVMLAPPIIPYYGPDFWAYRLATTPLVGPAFLHMVLGKYGATQLHPGAEASAWPETAPAGYVQDSALALILQPRTFINNAVQVMALKHHLADMKDGHADMPGTKDRMMIIHGNRDQTVSLKWNALPFLAMRPDVELIELKGAGHLLHHTWQDDILKAILRFARDGRVQAGHHVIRHEG